MHLKLLPTTAPFVGETVRHMQSLVIMSPHVIIPLNNDSTKYLPCLILSSYYYPLPTLPIYSLLESLLDDRRGIPQREEESLEGRMLFLLQGFTDE